MTFAVCLQVPNHIRFKRFSDIWTNFIPQMVFLQSIFGYLVVCIIYKWTVDWSQASTQPPSLLNMLIGMVLTPGTVDPETQLYRGQSTVQVILLLMAGVCVPWLLIAKPYLQYKEMQKIQGQGYIGLLGADEAPRHAEDVDIEGEEEGNGRAIVEVNDEEHVSLCTSFFLRAPSSYVRLWGRGRSNTISARSSCIRSSTRLSSVSDAFRTPPRTFVSGRSRWRTHSSPRCCGT